MFYFSPLGAQSTGSPYGVRLTPRTGKHRAWLLVYSVHSNQSVLSGVFFYVELEMMTQLTSADRSMTRHLVCALPVYPPQCYMIYTALSQAVGTEVCIRALFSLS